MKKKKVRNLVLMLILIFGMPILVKTITSTKGLIIQTYAISTGRVTTCGGSGKSTEDIDGKNDLIEILDVDRMVFIILAILHKKEKRILFDESNFL